MNTKLSTYIITFFSILFSTAISAQENHNSNLIRKQVPIQHASAIIGQLSPISYEFIQSAKLNLQPGIHYGIETASVKQVIPWAINHETVWTAPGKNSTGTLTYERVELERLIPFMVSAIQEQQSEITMLKNEISKLKTENKAGGTTKPSSK